MPPSFIYQGQTYPHVGALIRAVRQQQGYTQLQVAGFSGVGLRFLSDLENGKDSVQWGLVLKVLSTLQIPLRVQL
jgi:transcriptional regulator with XRE-family HTH domain